MSSHTSGHHLATVRRAGRKRGARFESSEALAEQPAVVRTAVELHGCCARVSLAEALLSQHSGVTAAAVATIATASRFATRARRAPHWGMPPPLHVKAVSALLNSVVAIAGVRNILAPGVPVALIPEDDVFQLHFHGDGKVKDAKMAFIFQLIGCFMLMAACTKFIVVFGHVEGTFLRQKLLFALGAVDLVTAAVVLMYKGMPESVTMGFSVLHGLEGAVFLLDAAFRSRKVKGAKKSS